MTWFALQSLLVIALSFGLGLGVGWLAWRRPLPARSRPQPAGPERAYLGGTAGIAAQQPEQPGHHAAVPQRAAVAEHTRPGGNHPPAAPARRSSTTLARRRQGEDLERIVGIGPAIAAALHAAGLSTYRELSTTSEDILRTALRAKGLRFPPTLPSWAEQARLLAEEDQAGPAELTGDLRADPEAPADE